MYQAVFTYAEVMVVNVFFVYNNVKVINCISPCIVPTLPDEIMKIHRFKKK